MNLNQKEVVLLSYPFSNLEGTKIRPALVISNESFNKKSADCIMVPLTTVIKDEPYSIILAQKDMCLGKLLKTSRVRVDKIFSVEKTLVRIKIGKVKDKFFEKIKEEIFKMF